MTGARFLSQFVASGLALSLAVRMLPSHPPSSIPVVLKIRSYAPHGVRARAIARSLRARGPVDREGISRDAYTRWSIRWRWPGQHGPLLDSSRIAVSLEGDILIPRVSRSVERHLPRWRSYHAALVSHELNHFRHALAGCERLSRIYLERAGAELSVKDAHRLAQQEVAAVRRIDRLYDQHTDNGRDEGVRWLWKTRR